MRDQRDDEGCRPGEQTEREHAATEQRRCPDDGVADRWFRDPVELT
jgi:hypothetical protein